MISKINIKDLIVRYFYYALKDINIKMKYLLSLYI